MSIKSSRYPRRKARVSLNAAALLFLCVPLGLELFGKLCG
jgi:hypothetical protein